jgi:hypothetical protein
MRSARTLSLLAAGTLLSGWLAGATLERSAVVMRVWLTLGLEPWVHFSHWAVLATGLTLEGVVRVAATALTFAAAASATFDRESERETPIFTDHRGCGLRARAYVHRQSGKPPAAARGVAVRPGFAAPGLGSVGIDRELIAGAARWIMAAKL